MNQLNLAIKEALNASGNLKEANKAYLEFIKANFIIPLEKNSDPMDPQVLYLEDNGHSFLPVFTEMEFLDFWASDISQEINVLKLTGVNLLKGIGEQVTVCVDIGSDHYKEFNPSEMSRMRSMVLKLFKN